MGGKRWTQDEDNTLIYMASGYTWEEIQRALPDRTPHAILSRAKVKGVKFNRGGWTLNRLVRETGYRYDLFHKAKKVLGQHWKKSFYDQYGNFIGVRGSGTRYIITDEQAEAMIAWIGRPAKFLYQDGTESHHWARKWDRCQECGTDGTKVTQRHHAHGFCKSCYEKSRAGPGERTKRVRRSLAKKEKKDE